MIERLKSVVSGSDTREFALVRRNGQPDDPSKIKSYDRKKSPYEVEIEEDLPVGQYYLQEIKKNGDFGEQLWSETLFGSESELEDVKKQAERAEQRAEEAKTEVERSRSQPGTTAHFDDPNEALRYEVRRGIVENPTLMEAYGDQVIDWALNGVDPDVSYEIENEWQAFLHDLRSNPEKAQAQVELAETVVRRLGRAGAQGVVEGFDGDDAEDQEEAEAVEEEESGPTRTEGPAMVTLEDLGGDRDPSLDLGSPSPPSPPSPPEKDRGSASGREDDVETVAQVDESAGEDEVEGGGPEAVGAQKELEAVVEDLPSEVD